MCSELSLYDQKIQSITNLFEKLKSEHNELKEWEIKLSDKLKTTAGRCCYTQKRIDLSSSCVNVCSEDQYRDILLHEVAHALAGKNTHHGPQWKFMAKKIGCSGERCHQIIFTKPKYQIKCSNSKCNVQFERHVLRLKLTHVCKKCKSKFNVIKIN